MYSVSPSDVPTYRSSLDAHEKWLYTIRGLGGSESNRAIARGFSNPKQVLGAQHRLAVKTAVRGH